MSNELSDLFGRQPLYGRVRKLHEEVDQKDAKRKGKGGDAASLRKDRTDNLRGDDGANSK